MKTFIAITSFALTIGLSGVAHAGFNDQGPTIDTTPTRVARQDLSQVPVVHGFNQQSHHAVAVTPASRRGGTAGTSNQLTHVGNSTVFGSDRKGVESTRRSREHPIFISASRLHSVRLRNTVELGWNGLSAERNRSSQRDLT